MLRDREGQEDKSVVAVVMSQGEIEIDKAMIRLYLHTNKQADGHMH